MASRAMVPKRRRWDSALVATLLADLLDQLQYVDELPNKPVFNLFYSLYFLTTIKIDTYTLETCIHIHAHKHTDIYKHTCAGVEHMPRHMLRGELHKSWAWDF